MAYATYTTQAVVCGTFDRNTADRSYRLFTREAGMLYADARSVRLEKSRQRYGLTDFSEVRVSLVRGKAGWKIGSIVAWRNFYHETKSQAARGHVRDLVRVLRRFVTGEEPAPEFYDIVVESLEVLAKVAEQDQYLYDTIVLKMLAELGYVSAAKIPKSIRNLRPIELTTEVTNAAHPTIKRLLTHAESVSHL